MPRPPSPRSCVCPALYLPHECIDLSHVNAKVCRCPQRNEVQLTTPSVFAPTRLACEQRTRWAATTASHEKWDWDWCNRPLSALPSDRVESLLTRFDRACSGGQGRSISEPKRASTARPTASAARSVAIGVAEPRTATETGSTAAGAGAEEEEDPAREENAGEGPATTEEGATGEAATGQPPSAGERAAAEQEAGTSLAAAVEAGSGRREMARKKGKATLEDRKAEEGLDQGRREATLFSRNSARSSDVSCCPDAKMFSDPKSLPRNQFLDRQLHTHVSIIRVSSTGKMYRCTPKLSAVLIPRIRHAKRCASVHRLLVESSCCSSPSPRYLKADPFRKFVHTSTITATMASIEPTKYDRFHQLGVSKQ